jgi:hypothetical protein
MVYCTWKNHIFGLCPSSNVSKIIMVWKLDLFPSSRKVMGAPSLLGPIERASLSHWTTSVKRSETY